MIKSKVTQAFGKAALTYDQESFVQQKIADEMMARLKSHTVSFQKALEIGCGTGGMSEKLFNSYPTCQWRFTDLSSQMVKACQDRLGAQAPIFQLDGENPRISESFDLIISNLAFQWFQDLQGSIQKLNDLLNPNGQLFFSTLGNDSFKEWRTFLQNKGVPIGLHQYPNQTDLEKMGLHVERQTYVIAYDNVMSFLKSLKAIGAQTPHEDHDPLSPAQLRRIIREQQDLEPYPITYEIYYCLSQKEAP